ncbi:DUF4928 family protein [Nocardia wallacei]|uniref:DUF4928 family protein n=1 Tax=Nocardia wallacei TaxID=480035 RepID=UPI0024565854|nr:DUF4928 family protein [Nocardia wallacei]
MTLADLELALAHFATEHNINSKGSLSLILCVTDDLQGSGLPVDPDSLLTAGGGQVRGLGLRTVQRVLARHGIVRILSKEGGRTSRGGIEKMRQYVGLLNEFNKTNPVDLSAVEQFWIVRVREYFAATPLTLRLDTSRGLRALVRDILAQAAERQRQMPGTQYRGAVLQHLVGAKLDCALGAGNFAHHSFSAADEQSGRAGDFLVGNTAIHVTTAPGEALIGRCRGNLDAGLRPIIVTIVDRANNSDGVALAEGLAVSAGLGDRIDVFEAEQFVALNLYELGGFAEDGRRVAVDDLVKRYNEIVTQVETDPSFRIAVND